MAGISVDLQAVVDRLSAQLGQMYAEVAMRDAALEAAHTRIAELEQPTEPPKKP